MLVLDAETLKIIADIIKNYAKKQKDIIDAFLKNVSNLGCEWQDDKTFNSLIHEIMKLKSDIYAKMDSVDVYANIFRDRAETIEQRPKFGQTSSSAIRSTATSVVGNATMSVQRREINSTSKIMQKSGFDKTKLCSDICEVDGVGKVENYVSICVDSSKISNLEHPGVFLSPANGEPIYAKKIAYRGYGLCTPNAQNVCGADFYYKDGTFCGSYTGTNWQDIFELNYSDTGEFRK